MILAQWWEAHNKISFFFFFNFNIFNSYMRSDEMDETGAKISYYWYYYYYLLHIILITLFITVTAFGLRGNRPGVVPAEVLERRMTKEKAILPLLLLLKYWFIYLAAPDPRCSMQDLWSQLQHVRSSFLTREWTWILCTGSAVLAIGPPGRSL